MNADSCLEEAVGRVLRVGVTTSSVCLAIGLTLTLLSDASSVSNVMLTTGLIILMATPVLRVMISLGEYFRERDWFFVLLTSIVFLELVASVVAAFR